MEESNEESDKSELTPEQEKHGMGCFASIVVLIIGIVGINWFSDPPIIETSEVVNGETQNWGLITGVESISGLYNLEYHLMYLLVDGDSMVLKSELRKDKSWDYQMLDTMDIEVVTISGIPIETGREDVIMSLKYTAPDDSFLIGKEGYLGLQATINYPSFNFEDIVVGSFTDGEINIISKELLIDEKFPMIIIREEPEFELWMLKEKIFTGLIFLSFFFGVYKLFLFSRGSKKAKG